MKIRNIFKKSLHNSFEVMGINERNVSLVYPNNKRKNYKLADDKVRSKEILERHGIPCAQTYQVIEKIGGIQKGWAALQSHTKMAIKPANGSGGGGIKILKRDDEGRWSSGGKPISDYDIQLHMASIIMGRYSLGSFDRVLIEECIEPHPFFLEIYPQGVPDIRIILLKGNPLMGMLRLPTDQSDGKANLHQGGLGIGIDMETGKFLEAYDGKHYHETHPDSQMRIANRSIPYWEEIVHISKQTALNFPLHYLGVDIVIDREKGPMIMEVNVRPGLGIQLANKQGLKKVLKKSILP